MRFVSVGEFRNQSGKIWKELSEQQELVITNNGHPIAMVHSITEDDLESCIKHLRQARAASAMSQLQLQSLKSGLDQLSEECIEEEIQAVRKERQR